jgi:mono/diheme cytochrome c family protein
MKIFKSLLILTTISLFIIACTQTEQTDNKTDGNSNKEVNAKPEPTSTVDELASGRKLYKEQCVKCHKEDGTGGEVEIEGKKIKADDLTSDKMKKMPDEKYIKYMVDGVIDEGMPSFKDILSDEEMKEVVKFIRADIQK